MTCTYKAYVGLGMFSSASSQNILPVIFIQYRNLLAALSLETIYLWNYGISSLETMNVLVTYRPVTVFIAHHVEGIAYSCKITQVKLGYSCMFSTHM